MLWKVLTILLVVCVIVYGLSSLINKVYIPEHKLKQCSAYGTIILDNDFDKTLLRCYIVKVIKLLSPVPYACRGLIPITNRVSHWLLALILNNDKVVVVNTNAKVFINVYNGRINKEHKIVNYKDYIGVIKHVYNVDNKLKLSTFLTKYISYFKANYKCYTMLGHNNCQYIVADCLKHIFGIHNNETTCEEYNIGILKEIYNNTKYATDFKNITTSAY